MMGEGASMDQQIPGGVSVAEPTSNPDPKHRRVRLESLDLLRGLVIVVMALDHVRDFFSITPFQPEDLDRTTIGLFATRWVTHFCAPVFVFLAGVGAALYGLKAGAPALRRFLLTRGVWLILTDVLIINFTWKLTFSWMFVQVIWAIGWSMVLLAAFSYLPRLAVGVLGLGMILGHNLLDGIAARDLGSWSWAWHLLHEQGWIPLGWGNIQGVFVIYPLIPWVGVIFAGYAIGPVFTWDPERRRRTLLLVGAVATASFVALRAFNLYGDPQSWSGQERGVWFTLASFWNTTKYPPSLMFLGMTLGPALLALPLLERWHGPAARVFVTFGRVPFFFYVLHIPLIHLAAKAYFRITEGTGESFFLLPVTMWPEGYEPSLIRVYLAWITVVALLYAPCRFFGWLKRRYPVWWIRYL